MRRPRRIAALAAAVALIALGAAACTPPANPPIDAPGTIANVVPFGGTPSFSDPVNAGTSVTSVAQVGTLMIAGGSFSQVNGAARPFLAAWTAPNGAIDTAIPAVGSAPTGSSPAGGEVDAIEPTMGRTGFYAAGHFDHVGSVATNVALFAISNGQRVTTFKPVVSDGTINTMQLVGTHLLIGGYFSRIDGVARQGLASVNYATGALEPFFNIQLNGHHNYRGALPNGQCPVGAPNCGQTGAISMAMSPDGSRVIVIGNFTNVKDSVNGKTGYARDQIVDIRMSTALPTVDPNWATPAFTNKCDSAHFDAYVQQVQWSPDGSFFVVVDSGGYIGSSLQACDSAVRYNASSTGLNVPPAWLSYTGKDSLYSVAVTSAAVYVGGHQRWMNNPYGQDNAKAGAVPRPGLAALDPANGVPLAWNPGRNPRGHGADVIYGTKTGVWVGSDTNCIGPASPGSCTGPGTYERDELAFFPYVGGTTPAPNVVGGASQIWKAGSWTSASPVLTANSFNPATGAGHAIAAPSSGGIDWSTVRGAFMLNGRIYYGKSDGKFYYVPFSGADHNPATYGAETRIDPYNDPTWDSVLTGSPTGSLNTYQGSTTNFYAEITKITSMFYANRSIYYTLSGDNRLFRRSFSPGTSGPAVGGAVGGGVISPVRVTVVDSAHGGLVDFTNAGGVWVANGHLFLASRTSGRLYQANWNGVAVSSHALLDGAATGTWAGRGVFIAQ
ncbi:MAG TPA: hypothetical protein VHX15_01950 [Frankiaceae bacterium]|jgi:hypothetical protein|nr:hypothetical protein [Frankiaceae bacterium]